MGLSSHQAESCQIVQRLLENETESVVMEKLINPDRCYLQFPPASIARLCREGCGSRARFQLVHILRLLDPSPEIVKALLHQSQLPSENPPAYDDDDIDVSVALALADAGEPELMLVVDLLVGSNQRMRKVAADAFFRALEKAPLELPALLVALDAVEKGSDPKLALTAGMTADRYRRWAEKSVDDSLAELLRVETLDDKLTVIRMLAVRRFSCRAKSAEGTLTQLSRDPDPDVAAAAKHSIAFRAKRCSQGN
jgi:hypothetical protein